MKTYPLKSIGLQQAIQFQFRMVDCITQQFQGHEVLNRGDLGVVKGLNKPQTTLQAERVIASFFDADKALLVRGAGTNAIRYALYAIMTAGETLLVHKAPIYNTTKTTIEMMGLKLVEADFNNLQEIKAVIAENPQIKGALVQYTRQKMEDAYDIGEVIKTIKRSKDIPVVTDDNYAVMKVEKIGVQYGADLSCFSCFKLLGPEGIGCVVGKQAYIDFLIKHHYSGGLQTQGHEALDVLHGLVYAPVALALQAQVNEELVTRLNDHEVEGVHHAFLANAQSKVLLVELKQSIAPDVLLHAQRLGAAPHPVGAESKYEIVPMFYRVSGTFLEQDPSLAERMIRINPMRSGADTVVRILAQSIALAREES